jgi:hypothetical protein
MSIEDDARTVYEYLVTHVLGERRATVTYKQIHEDCGVAYGEYGGHIGQVLGVISRSCAEKHFPPLTSIVVNTGDDIPGPGYFIELARIQKRGNPAGWRIDGGIDRWDQRPVPRGFDKVANRYEYREMIAEHQLNVFDFIRWPPEL